MLYLITGDNKPDISTFISKVKKDAESKGQTVHQFTKETKFTPVEIKDLINSSGMFSSGKAIFIYASKAENIDFGDELINLVKTDKENDIIIVDEGLNKLTSVYKNLKKHAQLKEFSLPRNYTNFNIADAIFIENDKKKAISLLQQLKDIETEAPAIVAVLYMGLRNYISIKQNNKSAAQIHPFIKKKNASSRYNLTDAKKLYMDLLDLDVKTKTNSMSKGDLIVDFMLYSI